MRARFLWVFIIALAAAALSATAALAMPSLGDFSWRVFASSLSLAGCLLGVMLCAFVFVRKRVLVLMVIAIAGFAAALLGYLAWIWFDYWCSYWYFATSAQSRAEDRIAKVALSVTLGSSVLMIVGLLRVIQLRGAPVRLVRVATETFSAGFATVSVLMLWEVFETWWLFPSEQVMRIWSSLLILSVAGLLATPALRAVEVSRHKSGAMAGLPARFKIRLACPRCGTEQSVTTGGAACSQCGLSIKVEVEEPLCPSCGYSLARLDADVCPECGSAVPG